MTAGFSHPLKKGFRMIVSLKLPIRCLAFCGISVIATTGTLSSVAAQDFEIIQRRLGGIVADGELSLEQASVMLRALHEFSEHQERERQLGDHQEEVRQHLRRLGVDDATQNQARETLEAKGIYGERLAGAMRVLARIFTAMRSTDHRMGISLETRRHLKHELDLSDDQISMVMNLATHFEQAERHRTERHRVGQRDHDRDRDRHNATEESIVDWIEATWMDLKSAVDSNNLSEDKAWQKWQKVIATQIEQKVKAALEAGDLTEAQVDRIKAMIEKNDPRTKFKTETHRD